MCSCISTGCAAQRCFVQRSCSHITLNTRGSADGQATVEGAFLIPVILLLLMLLIQPGILLYDRMVMNAAAAEGCRLIATQASSSQTSTQAYENFIRRRLGSIPQQDNFHVHSSGCTWEIEWSGCDSTEEVSVHIKTEVEPLPLFDFGASVLGLTNDSGNFTVEVEVTQTVRSEWLAQTEEGLNPQAWVER